MRTAAKAALLVAAIIFTAFCLRSPFTCIGPLADVIQADLGLSSGEMGTITTIPLLMFAAFSMAMGDLGRRRDAGGIVIVGLAMILVGVLCRSLLGTWGLFLGTAVIGIGITAGNVLLPAIIKDRFPDMVGALTGAYTAALSTMSAVAGAISVPLGDAVGWRGSLMVWAVLIVITLIVWVPNRRCATGAEAAPSCSRMEILRSGTTWFLAFYMGLQSLIYYSFVAWLSVIAQSKGLSATDAGMVNSAFMVLGIFGSLAVPVLAGRRRDLRALGAAMGALYVAGLLLLIPSGMLSMSLAVLLCGICGGTCITYVSMMYALRARTPGDASAVSGISQSIGYLVAATGPVLTGLLHDATGGWEAPIITMAAVAAAVCALGYLIGRDTQIGGARAAGD